jgi:ABC-type dipeptide/oligopeptide/nickel transport system ATPase component
MSLPDPEGLLERYPFELSGGMRQRIVIALALIHTPKLLIADEPGTALDVTVQNSINKELQRLVKEEGISMLYITHNLGVAKEMGERTYVMQYGKVVEEGNTEDVFLRPKETYTKDLLAALPKLV